MSAMQDLVAVVTDALVLSGLAGAVLLAGALVASRWSRPSGHVRHLLLWFALLVAPASFVGLTVARPGPVGCLTVPCASFVAGSGSVGRHYAFEAAGKFPGETVSGEPLGDGGGRSRAWLLLAVWMLGASVLVVRSARRRLKVRRLRLEAVPIDDPTTTALAAATARRLGLRRRPDLLHHADLPSPMVGGVLQPAVFLPSQFTRQPLDSQEMVLLHEFAHVQRLDAATSLVAELATACFWFDPLAWIAVARCSRVQEVAADSCVLERGVRPSRYADYLLTAWHEMTAALPSATLSIAGDCMVAERIRSVLDSATPHRTPARSTVGFLASGFAIAVALVVWSPMGLQGAGLVTQERRPVAATLNRALLTPQALDSLLRPVFINRMTDHYVAGAAISVVQGGRTVYAAGFGDREKFSEDPVDPARTIFRIGSITKVLTGIAVMQLVDRGDIDLDSDVNRYLEDIRVPATFDEPVRVRNLLTHTSGFDQIGLDRHADSAAAVVPLGEWIGRNLVRIRPPGEVSAYDTYGVTLAGHLVEQVSGTDYATYLRENIFAPLGMNRSGIAIPAALQADAAVGYGFAGEWEAMPWEYMNTTPASSVNATVTDMARLATMLLNGGGLEGRRILSERSVREMLSRQFTNDPDQPGYGYLFFENDWNGITTFSHGGSMEGFAAMLYLVPDYDLGFFIACNQESSAVIDPAVETLLGALFPDARPTKLRKRYGGDVDLSRFTGTYANNVYHHADPESGWTRHPFQLEATDDGALLFDGKPARPVGPLTFQRDDGLLLSFRENDHGRITHLFVKQAVYEKLD